MTLSKMAAQHRAIHPKMTSAYGLACCVRLVGELRELDPGLAIDVVDFLCLTADLPAEADTR